MRNDWNLILFFFISWSNVVLFILNILIYLLTTPHTHTLEEWCIIQNIWLSNPWNGRNLKRSKCNHSNIAQQALFVCSFSFYIFVVFVSFIFSRRKRVIFPLNTSIHSHYIEGFKVNSFDCHIDIFLSLPILFLLHFSSFVSRSHSQYRHKNAKSVQYQSHKKNETALLCRHEHVKNRVRLRINPNRFSFCSFMLQ